MISAATTGPAPGELAQLRYYLSAIRDGRLDIAYDTAQRICRVASGWGDFELWKEALEICEADSDISALGSEELLASVIELGFSNLEPM